jgi:hypothetical protein
LLETKRCPGAGALILFPDTISFVEPPEPVPRELCSDFQDVPILVLKVLLP